MALCGSAHPSYNLRAIVQEKAAQLSGLKFLEVTMKRHRPRYKDRRDYSKAI